VTVPSAIPVPRNQLLVGDAVDHLRTMSSSSIDMVLTSPPYFRLRDYQVAGQLGAEPTVDAWAANLRRVARQLHRILVPTGTLWLNVGDTYATHRDQGAGRKALLLGPERLALLLAKDGWLLRNKIVWAKTNAMPTSARDRLASHWEALYLFARQPTYFLDLDAMRIPHTSPSGKRHRVTGAVRGREAWRGPNSDGASGLAAIKAAGMVGHPLGKNPGDVWHIATSNYRGSHHATFPTNLAERAIRAGCPEVRCVACRLPWRRRVIRSETTARLSDLAPGCGCGAHPEPGLVLDPFIGSGTTAVAAEGLARDWLGIELNPDFAAAAADRINHSRVIRTAAA
jgi:site-specific DNA-methyltransferase (adenine-specific)